MNLLTGASLLALAKSIYYDHDTDTMTKTNQHLKETLEVF